MSDLFKYLIDKNFFNQPNKSGFTKEYRSGYRSVWINSIRDYSP